MNKEDNVYQADLINMILGSLIALKSEQQVGCVSRSPGSETLFLGKWLKRAKKQRHYPKSISETIDNFLMLYSQKGRNSDLTSSFNQIYNEYQTLKINSMDFQKSPKQRFDAVMDVLREKNWSISLPLAHDDTEDGTYKSNKEKELFVMKKDWVHVFDDQNELTKPLSITVVSTPQEAVDSFYLHGFILAKMASRKSTQGCYHHYKLFPDNKYDGTAAIPSKYKD
jgi:hypothetical protein